MRYRVRDTRRVKWRTSQDHNQILNTAQSASAVHDLKLTKTDRHAAKNINNVTPLFWPGHSIYSSPSWKAYSKTGNFDI